jgi:hypothetical protein
VHGTVYILPFSRLRGNDGFLKNTNFEQILINQDPVHESGIRFSCIIFGEN